MIGCKEYLDCNLDKFQYTLLHSPSPPPHIEHNPPHLFAKVEIFETFPSLIGWDVVLSKDFVVGSVFLNYLHCFRKILER